MAEIRFEKVAKRFGTAAIVKEMDLTIGDGEFFTFVGPSGCGKSTVLSMITGLEEVSGGRILFDGEDVTGLSPGGRDVAVVFQSYALYPHMTVFDNIAFPLRMKKKGRGEIEAEVRRVAALLGLEDLLGRRPGQLSGGQRQRVALGRAIVRRPRAFLMDEPLSNLDARLRMEMRGELKKLHAELGITTIYVTHDQAEALGLSERIAVLNRGEIQQVGTPQAIYFRPANLFVAGFIGSPPMNIVRGRLVPGNPSIFQTGDFRIPVRPERQPASAEVLLGIRPDDASVSEHAAEGGFEARVSVVEPAGSWNLVELDWQGMRFRGTASVEAPLKAGDRAFARVSPEKVLLFDAVTEERL